MFGFECYRNHCTVRDALGMGVDQQYTEAGSISQAAIELN